MGGDLSVFVAWELECFNVERGNRQEKKIEKERMREKGREGKTRQKENEKRGSEGGGNRKTIWISLFLNRRK